MDSESPASNPQKIVSAADFFYRLVALAQRAADVGAHDMAEELVELAYAAWDAAQREARDRPTGARGKLMSAIVLTGIAACSAGLAITGHAHLFHRAHLYPSLFARAHFDARRAIRRRAVESRPTELTFDPPLPSSLVDVAPPHAFPARYPPRAT